MQNNKEYIVTEKQEEINIFALLFEKLYFIFTKYKSKGEGNFLKFFFCLFIGSFSKTEDTFTITTNMIEKLLRCKGKVFLCVCL